MSLFIGIILAVIVFFVVVFIHELGHFLVSRWSGVKVEEFGIGIPPRLKRLFRDKKGTDWTLNWLPIGGFVRLKGEDFTSPESRDKDALPRAKWWKQIAILLAGVTMNFILAGIIFTGLFYVGTEPLLVHIREGKESSMLSRVGQGTEMVPIFNTFDEAVREGYLIPGILIDPVQDSIAMKSGLLAGDILIRVNGQTMFTPEHLPKILASLQSAATFDIVRNGEQKSISVTPVNGKIGAYVGPNVEVVELQYSFGESLIHGFREVGNQIVFSCRTFAAIIRTSFSDTASEEQKQEVTKSIGGPVAIGRVFVSLADQGIDLRSIVVLMAMISLSLGVFNLLPFPALDGGRILVILVNLIIHLIYPKFKITPRVEQIIHSAGFFLLILLSILVTYKDIFLQ